VCAWQGIGTINKSGGTIYGSNELTSLKNSASSGPAVYARSKNRNTTADENVKLYAKYINSNVWTYTGPDGINTESNWNK
jgi:hypothetical protein